MRGASLWLLLHRAHQPTTTTDKEATQAYLAGKTFVLDGDMLKFLLWEAPPFGRAVDWEHGGQLLYVAAALCTPRTVLHVGTGVSTCTCQTVCGSH